MRVARSSPSFVVDSSPSEWNEFEFEHVEILIIPHGMRVIMSVMHLLGCISLFIVICSLVVLIIVMNL